MTNVGIGDVYGVGDLAEITSPTVLSKEMWNKKTNGLLYVVAGEEGSQFTWNGGALSVSGNGSASGQVEIAQIDLNTVGDTADDVYTVPLFLTTAFEFYYKFIDDGTSSYSEIHSEVPLDIGINVVVYDGSGSEVGNFVVYKERIFEIFNYQAIVSDARYITINLFSALMGGAREKEIGDWLSSGYSLKVNFIMAVDITKRLGQDSSTKDVYSENKIDITLKAYRYGGSETDAPYYSLIVGRVAKAGSGYTTS